MKLKERLKHKYALSDQGVNDMIKGFVSVTISDLVLMLPVGMLYFLIRDYLQGNLSGRGWFYGVGIIVCLALVVVTTYIQYNATFLATYVESRVRRITLAEKLPDGYQTMIGENGCVKRWCGGRNRNTGTAYETAGDLSTYDTSAK